MNCDHIIRLARHYPRRQRLADCASIQRQLNLIYKGLATLLVLIVILRVQAELLRGIRTDERDIVPSQFRQRLWQFLQPAVVTEAAVVDGWIGTEYNFVGAGSQGPGVGGS